MTTECMCTTNTMTNERIYLPAKGNLKSKNLVWADLMRLASTIGAYAVEAYRGSNDPQPVFSNGGTRVLIRHGRIDLV